MRLQKYMALCGVASRRKAEEMIAQGRVQVNGQVVTNMGVQVDENADAVLVDGEPIAPETVKRLILLHKPIGYVCTVHDPEGRKTVLDLVKVPQRVYPVGRLDYDTQGLVLLTNDGELARALTHPSSEVDKLYIARVRGIPNKETMRALREGMMLEGEERETAPARADILRHGSDWSDLRILLHEGRNRQVRRMLEESGHAVLSLRRERIAFLSTEGLPPGASRDATPTEYRQLRALCHIAR